MQICRRTIDSVNVEKEGAPDSSSDGKAGSEPVRVRTGGASIAYVGPDAGKLHRVALA